MATLLLFNKPFQVLTQFTDEQNRATLANFLPIKGVYPAGRLDYDSEGLLLLTDDGNLQHAISHPRKKMPKTYWVQVEGLVSDESLLKLEAGVELKDGITKPARVKRITEPKIWPRNPPIRERKAIPTTWLELTIWEGKNRQVRRMTAAVGNPTLRLIRAQIGQWALADLQPGDYQVLEVDAPAKPKRPHTNRPKSRTNNRAKTKQLDRSKQSKNKPHHTNRPLKSTKSKSAKRIGD